MQHIHFSHFGSNYFLFNFFKANDFEREMAYRRRIIWGNAVDCTMCDIRKKFLWLNIHMEKSSCHMIINVPRKRWCSATAHWSSPVLSLNWSVGFITWTVWHTCHTHSKQTHCNFSDTFCNVVCARFVTRNSNIYLVDNMLACARAQARD